MPPITAVARRPDPGARSPLPLDVFGNDLLVPLVTGERIRHVNLDCAASPPCLRAAHAAITAALPWYGSIQRGAGFASAVSTRLLESARSTIGAFAGARPGDVVVLTRHTTDALNLLAGALPEDAAVVAFASEHHANLLPWRRLRHVQLPVPRTRAEAISRAEQALAGLRTRHRLLAVAGASNVTGELWPVAELCAAARRQGARVVVDAAQLAPHRRVDVAALGADWVAFSAHKLHAPFGCGALVGRADWLDAAQPRVAGGGAVRRVSLDAVEWAQGPARHEAGTPNLPGAIGFAAACRALTDVGWEDIEAHETALLQALLRDLAALPGVEILSLWGPGSPRIGVVSFTVHGWDPALLTAALSAEHGISVRDGAFCAHPLVSELVQSAPGSAPAALRTSVGAASRAEDVHRLIFALQEMLAHGLRWRYRRIAGRFVPDPDPRPEPDLGL